MTHAHNQLPDGSTSFDVFTVTGEQEDVARLEAARHKTKAWLGAWRSRLPVSDNPDKGLSRQYGDTTITSQSPAHVRAEVPDTDGHRLIYEFNAEAGDLSVQKFDGAQKSVAFEPPDPLISHDKLAGLLFTYSQQERQG
jgi:hypothetical protein